MTLLDWAMVTVGGLVLGLLVVSVLLAIEFGDDAHV
jgi:hypothetical protein